MYYNTGQFSNQTKFTVIDFERTHRTSIGNTVPFLKEGDITHYYDIVAKRRLHGSDWTGSNAEYDLKYNSSEK